MNAALQTSCALNTFFVENDLADAKDENGNWDDQLIVCPSSLDPIYIVAYYIRWFKTS